MLLAISKDPNPGPACWIFTECQTTEPAESEIMKGYLRCAKDIGAQLVSVILTCSVETNETRLVNRGPTLPGTSAKLVDPELLRWIRENRTIYTFGDQEGVTREVELDIDGSSVREAANSIAESIISLRQHTPNFS